MSIDYAPTVNFVGRKLRPAVRRLLRLRQIVKALEAEYWAQHQPVLVAGPDETVADGAPENGMPALTGAETINVVGKLIERIGDGVSDQDVTVLLRANGYDDVQGVD